MADVSNATESTSSNPVIHSTISTTPNPRNMPTSPTEPSAKGQVALSGALDSLSHLSLTDILKLREVLTRCDEGSLADAYVNTLTSRIQSQRESKASSLKAKSVDDNLLAEPQDDAQQRRRSKSVAAPPKPPQISTTPISTFPIPPKEDSPKKIEPVKCGIQRRKPAPLTAVSPALSDSSMTSNSTAAKSLGSKSLRSSVSSLDQELNELLGELGSNPVTPMTPAKPPPWSTFVPPPPPPPVEEKIVYTPTLTVPSTSADRVSRAETDIMSLLDYSANATAEEKRSEFWIRLQRDLMKTPMEAPVKHKCPESRCDKDFSRNRDLTKHLEADHSQLLKYMCQHTEPGSDKCEFATFDKKKWEDHHKCLHRCTPELPSCCQQKLLTRKVWACGLCYRQRFNTIEDWSRHYCKHIRQEGKTKENVSFSMKMFNLLWQDATGDAWGKQSGKTMKDGKFWIGWNENSANAQDLMHVLECGVFEGKDLNEPEVASKVVKLAIQLGKHPSAANVRASKYPTRTAYLKPFPRHVAHVVRDQSTKSA